MSLHLAPEQVGFKHAEDLTVASDHNWWEGGERKAVEAVLGFRQPGERPGFPARCWQGDPVGSIKCPSGNASCPGRVLPSRAGFGLGEAECRARFGPVFPSCASPVMAELKRPCENIALGF